MLFGANRHLALCAFSYPVRDGAGAFCFICRAVFRKLGDIRRNPRASLEFFLVCFRSNGALWMQKPRSWF
jgi:hypothetical protein